MSETNHHFVDSSEPVTSLRSALTSGSTGRGYELARTVGTRSNDPNGSQSIDLSALWGLLLAGRLVIRNTSGVGGHSLLELEYRAHASPLPSENSRIVERVLEGECPKALAAELGLTASTLSSRCASILVAMGIKGRVSRAPAILVMAVFASRCIALGRAHVECLVDGPNRWLIGVPNPISCLQAQLSPSEYEVAGLAIDGKTHAEIARARNTSERTVANQLASIFQKLRVSGRVDLRAKAIFEYALRSQGLVADIDAASKLTQPRFVA